MIPNHHYLDPSNVSKAISTQENSMYNVSAILKLYSLEDMARQFPPDDLIDVIQELNVAPSTTKSGHQIDILINVSSEPFIYRVPMEVCNSPIYPLVVDSAQNIVVKGYEVINYVSPTLASTTLAKNIVKRTRGTIAIKNKIKGNILKEVITLRRENDGLRRKIQ